MADAWPKRRRFRAGIARMYASPGAGVADELRMSNSNTRSDAPVLGVITKGRVRVARRCGISKTKPVGPMSSGVRAATTWLTYPRGRRRIGQPHVEPGLDQLVPRRRLPEQVDQAIDLLHVGQIAAPPGVQLERDRADNVAALARDQRAIEVIGESVEGQRERGQQGFDVRPIGGAGGLDGRDDGCHLGLLFGPTILAETSMFANVYTVEPTEVDPASPDADIDKHQCLG